MGCQSCNSCQGCNSGCQNYCKTGQNSNNGFQYSYEPKLNNIMGPGFFDWNVWNEGIDKINEVFSRGKTTARDTSIYPATISRHEVDINNEITKFMTADEFKRVCNSLTNNAITMNVALKNFIDNGQIEKDKVIYAEYFQQLQNAIQSLYYGAGQCQRCNNGCESCDGGLCGNCCERD